MSIAVENDLRSIQRLADIPWQDLVEVLGEETDGFHPVNIFSGRRPEVGRKSAAAGDLKAGM